MISFVKSMKNWQPMSQCSVVSSDLYTTKVMHDINWLIADGTNVVLTVGFARQYMQKYRKPHFTDK